MRTIAQRSVLIDLQGECAFVWLLMPGLSLGPWSLCCDWTGWSGVKEEQLVACTPEGLWVGKFFLPYAQGSVFDPQLRCQGLSLSMIHAQKHLLPDPLLVEPRLGPKLARAQDLGPSELRGLVGLGSGSTPEGDDVLLGLRAAWHLRRELGEPVPLDKLDALLCNVSTKDTHPVSVRTLSDALQGDYPESVLALFQALGTPDGELEKACDWVLTLGHSSGAAILYGIRWGLFWPLPDSL